jgi:hypothetical protein
MKTRKTAAKPLLALRSARVDFSNRLRVRAGSRERRMSKTAQRANCGTGSAVVVLRNGCFTRSGAPDFFWPKINLI